MDHFQIFAIFLGVVALSTAQLGSVHCKVGCACAEDYQPICASDRRTYANECKLRCKQCETKGLEAVFYGRCEDVLLLAPAIQTAYSSVTSEASNAVYRDATPVVYSSAAPVAYSAAPAAYSAAAPVAYRAAPVAYRAAAPVAYRAAAPVAYRAAAPVAYRAAAPSVAYTYYPYAYHSI